MHNASFHSPAPPGNKQGPRNNVDYKALMNYFFRYMYTTTTQNPMVDYAVHVLCGDSALFDVTSRPRWTWHILFPFACFSGRLRWDHTVGRPSKRDYYFFSFGKRARPGCFLSLPQEQLRNYQTENDKKAKTTNDVCDTC